MPPRLLMGFGRKPASESGNAPAAVPGAGSAAPQAAPASSAAQANTPVNAALELARELLRGVEHFVLSTPDLDAPGFLDRLRRTAAHLNFDSEPTELEGHRRWAADSLSAFGQLQRRYLSEREDELWRLLSLYQENQKMDGAANQQFHENLRGVHDRLGTLARLDDLRQVRERLETELQRAGALLEQKTKQDDERASNLTVQVQQLEAALIRARHEATRDALTGIYHRGGFETQLEAALISPARCALAMIDLDNFKGINDTLGHLVGDQILQMAVNLLSKIARPGDVLGRYGGDEFCLLAPGTPPDRLAERFDRIASQRPINFKHEGRFVSVRISFSVGVAGSVAGDTRATIIKRADEALYEVKRAGKGYAKVAAAPVEPPSG